MSEGEGVRVTSVQLAAGESVRLASAVAQFVADSIGVRVLHVKGPAAAIVLGFHRDSSDVDVLVHPADWSAYVEALEAVGFSLPSGSVPSALGHSVDLLSPGWGAGIDVHHRFPGIEVAAAEAFEVLWDSRTEVELAGVRCPTPGPVAHTLVIGLHAARSPRRSQKWDEADLAWEGLSDGQRHELMALARVLDAEEALGVRWSAFTEHSTEEARRLWAALARRDAEAVWWMRVTHARSVRDVLLLVVRGVPRYLRSVRARHPQDLRGAGLDVVGKGRRWARAGTVEVRRATGARLGARRARRGG